MAIYNNQLDTRQVYILDVSQAADQIETILRQAGLLIAYPTGYYLPMRSEPAMVVGKPYWYETVVQVPVSAMCYQSQGYANRYHYEPVVNLADIPTRLWDIIDKDDGAGKVVVRHHELSQLRQTPYLPIHGIAIMHENLMDEVYATRAYECNLRRRPLEEILKPYVLYEQALTDPNMQEMFNYLFDVINTVRRGVREFLEPSTTYGICNLEKLNATTYQINLKGDHRILEWEQAKATGKW